MSASRADKPTEIQKGGSKKSPHSGKKRRAPVYALLVACVLGVTLTVGSLAIKRYGIQMYCAPVNAGPLDDLGAAIRYERGFPLAYYTDPMPKGCFGEMQTMSLPEEPDHGARWLSALADFLVYAGVSFVAVWPILRRRYGE